MTPAARTEAVIDLLDMISETSQPADSVMSRYFRDRRYIGSKDRHYVADKTYDTLRYFLRLKWWCQHLKMPVFGRNLVLAHHALVERYALSGVEQLWNGDKFCPRPLQRSEKEFYIALSKNDIAPDAMDEATRYECPDWAYEFLKEKFGPRFAEEMQATLRQAPLDLRANSLKNTREDAAKILDGEGIRVEQTPYAAFGLRTNVRAALSRSAAFQNGLVEIQDEGSQLIAELCSAEPGMQVLDLCAGAGGKTLALGAAMQNKGRLIACDISEGRLRRSKERLKRAGVQNAQLKLLDSEGNKWLKRNAGSFDRVLVDAPCTGTGTWRRNPDLRWRAPDLEELLKIQSELLDKAAKLVKPGGQLIYGTCSFLDQENKSQITAFLERHADFKIHSTKEILSFLESDFMELTPAQHQTDGFFAAILIKAQPLIQAT